MVAEDESRADEDESRSDEDESRSDEDESRSDEDESRSDEDESRSDEDEVTVAEAKFAIGAVVRHRLHPFRGVIYDVDPIFSNSEEWYESIPADMRPAKDQPYYHLLAENAESTYEAYVSEQNLLPDESGEPCRHPLVDNLFRALPEGGYSPRENTAH
jgi:heat shock protein HspQ